MARIEPSLYEPTDDSRIFDGAEEAEDEGSRLPLLIVVALLVLAAFTGVVWLAYSQGVARGQAGAPRILAAASSPIKVAPSNPGGAASPYRGLKIYQQPASKGDGNDRPQSSSDQQSRTGMKAAVTNSQLSDTKTEKKLAAETLPMPSAPPRPSERPSLRTDTPSNQIAADHKMSEAMKPAPEKLVPRISKSVAKPPAARMQPRQPVEDAGPQSTQKVASSESKPPSVPVSEQSSPAVVIPTKSAANTANSVTSVSSYVLQIGSFKSEADARSSWERFKTKHSALVANYGPNIQSVDLGAKGTWYRLRVGAFADKSMAADTCIKLRADGASCLLAR